METTNETTTAVRTSATQGTDIHKSKISPDDPRLRVERPRSRALRKGPALIAAAAVALTVAVALVVALANPSAEQDAATNGRAEATQAPTTAVDLPDVLREAPARDTPSPSHTRGSRELAAGSAEPIGSQPVEAARQLRQEELLRARGAGVFSGVDDGPVATTQAPAAARTEGGNGVQAAPSPPADPSKPADPNLQERKNDFLARAGVSDAEYLEKAVTPPRSPYEVKAGTVIPTVLISGINSDLPGQVVAQVRENVYDTVSGNYLLIPQGSRLLAAYDSMVAWGQERVLVCWNLLCPSRV